jgi:hypothetical protein
MLDKSVVINIFSSDNHFVPDLVMYGSASFGEDTDSQYWHATKYHPFHRNMNRKLYQDRYLIPDCTLIFIYNFYALSKSNRMS